VSRTGWWLLIVAGVALVVGVVAWKIGWSSAGGAGVVAAVAGAGARRRYQRKADVLRSSAREQPGLDAAADARVEAQAERAKDKVVESSNGEEFDPDEPSLV
jgi:hypothetical protein